jgi:hypothetical protein
VTFKSTSPEKNDPDTNCIGRWVGPIKDLDALEKI